MQAQWRAEFEVDCWELGGEFAAEAFQVASDVRAGAQEVGQHSNFAGSQFDTLPGPVRDRWLGQFQVTRDDDFILAGFPQPIRDLDEILIRLGPAASVRDKKDGSRHWRAFLLRQFGVEVLHS